jgi:predicted metal-dependent peptidase
MTIAISRLLAKQPFFAVLLFEVLKIRETEDEVPTAATNGKEIIVNTPWFAKLTPDQRIFLLAHEVMHVVLNHLSRAHLYEKQGFGPDLQLFDKLKANVAMDLIINDWLSKMKVGTLPPGGLHPAMPEFSQHNISMADIWDEVYTRITVPPRQGNQGAQGTGFDDHEFNPGPGGHHAEADIRAAVVAAHEAAKAQGKGNTHLDRMVGKLVEKQVDWRTELRMEISMKAGRDDETWARPNRKRLALAPNLYLPGRSSNQAGIVAAYTDSSGSVSPKEFNACFGEIASIYEDTNPEELWIGDCSDEASDPELVDSASDITDYKNKKGGGTHMPAIFDKLNAYGITPEVCVVLTDGYTDWGTAPGYPVVWVITTRNLVAPYGKSIFLDLGHG